MTPSALQVAIHHCCPACGKGSIYSGILQLAVQCPECGLSLRAHDSGDGPAFFTITLLGFVVVGFATWLEFAYRPAFWVTMLASAAMLAVLTPLSLRFFKSYLLAMQYKVNRLPPAE